jgi:hypothetical protein
MATFYANFGFTDHSGTKVTPSCLSKALWEAHDSSAGAEAI